MEKAEYLVALDKAISDLWEDLAEVAPEATKQLREYLTEAPKAIEAAKKELRSMGKGKHQIGDVCFKVSGAGTKTVFNLDDVIFEAEDNGHLGVLIDAGFVKYSIDAKQLERLPPQILPIYQELATTTEGTLRVSIPANLCK